MSFHKHIFKVFTDSELNIQRYESYGKGNSKNCVAVGYPKLDVYLVNDEIDSSKYWKNPERIKIIYAPLHSFEIGGIDIRVRDDSVCYSVHTNIVTYGDVPRKNKRRR